MQAVSVEERQRTNAAVGRRIREARLEKGLSQKKLAEMVKIDSKYLSLIENGHSGISRELLMRIGKIFDKGLDYFYMDVPESGETYALDEDIALKLKKCSKGQKLLISRLIEAVLAVPKEDLSI